MINRHTLCSYKFYYSQNSDKCQNWLFECSEIMSKEKIYNIIVYVKELIAKYCGKSLAMVITDYYYFAQVRFAFEKAHWLAQNASSQADPPNEKKTQKVWEAVKMWNL